MLLSVICPMGVTTFAVPGEGTGVHEFGRKETPLEICSEVDMNEKLV